MTPFLTNCVCVPPSFNNVSPVQCIADTDCASGESCIGGLCRTVNTECSPGIIRSCFIGGNSACQYGEQKCVGGRWGSCVPKTSGQQEVCDGIDNDCDGSVDESFPEKGQKCIVLGAKGACAEGTYQSCSGGQPQCASTSQPKAEGPPYNNCNDGVDNDCDGFVDDPNEDGCQKCTTGEVRKCYPHGQGVNDSTVGKGVCVVGTQSCLNGTWEPCKGAVTPTPEQCNDKLDNDCDGTVDNGCNEKCDPIGSSRPCYSGPQGTQGVGLCVTGVQVCGDNAQWGACSGEVIPTKENCTDGQDNDCNGKVDDCGGADCRAGDTRQCYSGPTGTGGVGICTVGQEGCTKEGKWSGVCQGEVVPGREICGNGKDDNCNGKVDDCNVTQLLSTTWDKLEPIKLWDTTTNKSIRSFLKGHTDTVYSSAFSADGKTLFTSGHDKQVVAWEADTGKILWSKAQHTDAVHSLAMDASGKFLVSGSADNDIILWTPSTGAVSTTFKGHTGAVYALAWGPGIEFVSGSADGTARIWRMTSGLPPLKFELKGHALEIFAVAFHPKGTMVATGSRDTTVKLWDPNTGKEIQTLSKHTKSVTAMAFSNDGKYLATGSADNSVMLWDVSKTPAQLVRTMTKAGSQAIYALTFHPVKGTIVAGSYSGSVIFWDPATGTEIASYSAGLLPVSSLIYRP